MEEPSFYYSIRGECVSLGKPVALRAQGMDGLLLWGCADPLTKACEWSQEPISPSWGFRLFSELAISVSAIFAAAANSVVEYLLKKSQRHLQ